MTDADLSGFLEVFQRVRTVFRLRGDETEIQQIGALYFKTLRKYPLPVVAAGAETWVERGKYFPKPAEWIDALPRRSALPDSIPELTEDEAHDYLHAERLGFEDVPCGCVRCRGAGVHKKPIRFVPEVTPGDTDQKVRCLDRLVTAGHWAHGEELKGWYVAKAAFYARCKELGFQARTVLSPKARRRSFQERMDAIVPAKQKPTATPTVAREPGQEG